MARGTRQASERPLHWVGTSKADYLAFPALVVSEMGYALGLAQLGGMHPAAKSWKGEGPGIMELVRQHTGNAYRAIYTVRFAQAVYVLHVFQKKSPRGIKTDRRDVAMVRQRLKAAQADYAQQYETNEG